MNSSGTNEYQDYGSVSGKYTREFGYCIFAPVAYGYGVSLYGQPLMSLLFRFAAMCIN
jgi:hypothetical protein